MNFKEYVEAHRAEIFNKIDGYLRVKEPAKHYEIARDYSVRQGSYRRPGLLMLTGQMFGAKREDLLLPSAAMQMSEDWILIHDDVEDDSEMRRGKPALHRIYGNEIAINAGDAVHLAMWRVLIDVLNGGKTGFEKAFVDKFYGILEETVEGQYVETDFMYNVKALSKADENLYYRIIKSKTCHYTVYGPMQLGAILAGRGDDTMDALKEIGYPAGIAFQITDDILDMTADEKVFGKKRYGDLYEGKLTLIVLHAYQKSTAEERKEVDRIYLKRRKDKTQEEIAYIVGLIEKYDGLGYASEMAERYGQMAKNAVEKYKHLFPEGEFTETLLSAMKEMYVRKK